VSKQLKTAAKIIISIALLYWVYTKIDFSQIVEIWKKSNPFHIILAIIFFVFSQIISSFRLNGIFHKNNHPLESKSNLKLYFVGMFYNFFIPGGVGGDAYKVFLLNKQFDWNVKSLTKCVIIDRLTGLIAIFLWLLILGCYIFFNSILYYLVCILLVLISFFIGKKIVGLLFKTTDSNYNNSVLISFIIQFLQILTVVALIFGFNFNTEHIINYCFVFLISSVLSVVSFAGFGSREYVFLQAANFLHTDPSLSTSIALAFNIITMLISLFGLIFMVLKLNLKSTKPN